MNNDPKKNITKFRPIAGPHVRDDFSRVRGALLEIIENKAPTPDERVAAAMELRLWIDGPGSWGRDEPVEEEK